MAKNPKKVEKDEAVLMISLEKFTAMIFRKGSKRIIKEWEINQDAYVGSGRAKLLEMAEGLPDNVMLLHPQELERLETSEFFNSMLDNILEFGLVDFDKNKAIEDIMDEDAERVLTVLAKYLFGFLTREGEGGWKELLVDAITYGRDKPLVLMPKLRDKWYVSWVYMNSGGTIHRLHKKIFCQEPTEEDWDLYDAALHAWEVRINDESQVSKPP